LLIDGKIQIRIRIRTNNDESGFGRPKIKRKSILSRHEPDVFETRNIKDDLSWAGQLQDSLQARKFTDDLFCSLLDSLYSNYLCLAQGVVGQGSYGIVKLSFQPGSSQTTFPVPSWILFDYLCLVQGVVGQGSYGIVKLAFRPGSSQTTFSVPSWMIFN
jgi:hypothetical protein